jgi:hypothetical protein
VLTDVLVFHVCARQRIITGGMSVEDVKQACYNAGALLINGFSLLPALTVG